MMPDRFTPQQVKGIREPGMRTFPGAGEILRPPRGTQVVVLNAEPFSTIGPNLSNSVRDPKGDVMFQWNTTSHWLHPNNALNVPLQHPSTQFPEVNKPEVSRRIGGLIGTGSGAMIFDSDRKPWIEKYLDFLRGAADAQIVSKFTCFSAQAFAEAMGGDETVRENPSQVRNFGVGRYNLTDKGREHWLLEGLDDGFLAYRSHFQSINPDKLPRGVEVLAVDADDGYVAALGYGNIGAIQFHTDLSMEAMYGLAIGREDELLNRGITLSDFSQELKFFEEAVMHTNNTINHNFYRRMFDQAA